MVYGVQECTKCHEVKPLGEFYRQAKGHGFRNRQCKDCIRKYTNERYHNIRDAILEKQREYEARPEVAAHKLLVRREASWRQRQRQN